MSMKLMTRIWDEATDVEGTDLLVLLALADWASESGRSFPLLGTLCRRVRRSERTVQEAFISLEAKGWLERQPRAGRSTIYQIVTPAAHRTPAESAPPQPAAGDPRSVPHQPPQSTAPITIKEPPFNPGGGVSEVSTEQHPVTERPFPRFAIAALGSGTTLEQQQEWVAAWHTVTAIATVLDPTENLTKYFARCKERKTPPKPPEWIRWFVDDQVKERRAVTEEANHEATTKPWFE